MSVAYITGLTAANPSLAVLALTSLDVNQDGIVSVFKSSSSPDNPNTFSLIPGNYQIEVITNVGISLSAIGNAGLSFLISLFEETTNTVRSLGNTQKESLTYPGGGGTSQSSSLSRLISVFSFFSGIRTYSIKYQFLSSGGYAGGGYSNARGTVTATLGGSVVPAVATQIKIIRS